MPDFTYLQAAQPTTAGHWLLSFAHPALRDAQRLARRLRERSIAARPAPAASTARASRSTASGSAQLLGFDAPIDAHARRDVADRRPDRDASGTPRPPPQREPLRRGPRALRQRRVRPAAIGDELCRASALMPQKRNPYALVVIRGAAGTLLGRATGVLATQRTPSGRTDNLLYAYGEVGGAVELATRTRRPRGRRRREPARSTARRASARAARRASRSPPTSPRSLSLQHGLDYRSAYDVVGRAVARTELDRRRRSSAPRASCSAARSTIAARPVADALDPAPRSPPAPSPAAPRPRRWTRCCATAGRHVARRGTTRRWSSGRDALAPASGRRRNCVSVAVGCGSRSSVSKRRPRRSVSSAITSSGAMLPRLTFGPDPAQQPRLLRALRRLEDHGLLAHRGEDRVHELAVHGARGVEQPDRPALAPLGDHQRGARREVAEASRRTSRWPRPPRRSCCRPRRSR